MERQSFCGYALWYLHLPAMVYMCNNRHQVLLSPIMFFFSIPQLKASRTENGWPFPLLHTPHFTPPTPSSVTSFCEQYCHSDTWWWNLPNYTLSDYWKSVYLFKVLWTVVFCLLNKCSASWSTLKSLTVLVNANRIYQYENIHRWMQIGILQNLFWHFWQLWWAHMT